MHLSTSTFNKSTFRKGGAKQLLRKVEQKALRQDTTYDLFYDLDSELDSNLDSDLDSELDRELDSELDSDLDRDLAPPFLKVDFLKVEGTEHILATIHNMQKPVLGVV